jgi:hypothetical protein
MLEAGTKATRVRRWRSSGQAAGISFAVHMCLGLIVWTAAGWSTKVVIADADAGEGEVIAIGVQELDTATLATNLGEATPQSQPTDSAQSVSNIVTVAPPPVAPPRERRTARASTENTAIAQAGPIARAAVPRIRTVRTNEPPEIERTGAGATTDTGNATLAPLPVPDDDSYDDEESAPAPIQAAPAIVRTGEARSPVYVPAEVASYLRAQDSFPALPASLRRPGAHYLARMEICVAQDGRVSDVDFDHQSPRDLGVALGAAVRGWRYRPLMVDGRAAPFCHRLTVSYEIH